MLQQVKDDGIGKIGQPGEVLRNDQAALEQLVEAPGMIKTDGGEYVLFYSSGCWNSRTFDLRYATSKDLKQGFVKAGGAMLETLEGGLTGPGSARIAADRVHMAFHAYNSTKEVGKVRSMYVGMLGQGDSF